MKPSAIILRCLCFLAVQAFVYQQPSYAQLISIRSVPVATAEQSLLFPSENLGMGGVAIALDDPPADPFVNPAKGARLRGFYGFSSPAISNVTGQNGAFRTLPVGVMYGSKRWFGGASLAAQQYDGPDRPNTWGSWGRWLADESNWGSNSLLAEDNTMNMYGAAYLGTTIGGTGLSVAASAAWAELQAVAGVDFLYANSSHIDQFGHLGDFRIGLLGESSEGPSFELVLLHNRFRMTHTVYQPVWPWFDVAWTESFATVHQDYTDTWGLHAGTVKPLADNSARLGFIFTANRKTHPKIPNYDIMNIPRDPGDSWAFNIGGGVARRNESSAVAIDLIYEPIFSNTWADAAEPITTASGKIIPAGGKTIENDFRFSNWLVRLGLRQQSDILGFQLGLQLRAIHYRLEQVDNIAETERSQKEFWLEWTPTLGLNLNFPSFQLRYAGRLTTGTGQPGIAPNWSTAEATMDRNFIIAPGGALTLQEALVLTHQISIAVALGK